MTQTNVFLSSRMKLGIDHLAMANLIGLGKDGADVYKMWECSPASASALRHSQIDNIMAMVEIAKIQAPLPAPRVGDFTFIDLFAGIGGMRLGFQSQQGRCVFTSEWDKFAQKTYLMNYGEIAHGDIRDICSRQVPDHDILLAGFPCQAFSQAGLKKGFYDTRGTLFFEVQRILVEKRPKAFLLENVKQLKGHDKGRTLKTIIDTLKGEVPTLPEDVILSDEVKKTLAIPLNYDVHMKVLSSRDFGLPQHRERIFIVGFDKDQTSVEARSSFLFPKPTAKKTRISDILVPMEEGELAKLRLSDKLWAGHQLRREKHAAKGNGFGCNVFTPEQAYTVTLSARYYKDGAEILIDQSHLGKNPRKLSPREAAYLQGFPKQFIVDAVSSAQFYKQCGNAVSVNVIKEIARNMKTVIQSK